MKGPVVVKVGGSLLDWPELPPRLTAYLEGRRDDRLVLVVGGGSFADALRGFDAVHRLGESLSHALALRVLDITAHALAALVTGLVVVDEMNDLSEAWSRNFVPVLSPRRFLDNDDCSPDPLPHAWTTTTDAIAARLAVHLEARELVLLKSTPLPFDCNPQEAARLGLVDAEFPRASERLSLLTYHDLRALEPTGRGLRPT